MAALAAILAAVRLAPALRVTFATSAALIPTAMAGAAVMGVAMAVAAVIDSGGF